MWEDLDIMEKDDVIGIEVNSISNFVSSFESQIKREYKKNQKERIANYKDFNYLFRYHGWSAIYY